MCSGADGRAYNPSYRLEVTVEFGEPVFTFEDGTSQHIGHGEVNTFGYSVSAGTPITLPELLEFVTIEFPTIIVNDGSWTRVSAEPFGNE